MTNKVNKSKKDWRYSKLILIVTIALFIIASSIVISLLSELSKSYSCEKEINLLKKQQTNVDWNQMVKAPEGFSQELIPLSLSKQIECERR